MLNIDKPIASSSPVKNTLPDVMPTHKDRLTSTPETNFSMLENQAEKQLAKIATFSEASQKALTDRISGRIEQINQSQASDNSEQLQANFRDKIASTRSKLGRLATLLKKTDPPLATATSSAVEAFAPVINALKNAAEEYIDVPTTPSTDLTDKIAPFGAKPQASEKSPDMSFDQLRELSDLLDEMETRDSSGFLWKYNKIMETHAKSLEALNKIMETFSKDGFAKPDGDSKVEVKLSDLAHAWEDAFNKLANQIYEEGFLTSNSPNPPPYEDTGWNLRVQSIKILRGREAFWKTEFSKMGLELIMSPDDPNFFFLRYAPVPSIMSKIGEILVGAGQEFPQGSSIKEANVTMTNAQYQQLIKSFENVKSDFENVVNTSRQKMDTSVTQSKSLLDLIARCADDIANATLAWLKTL